MYGKSIKKTEEQLRETCDKLGGNFSIEVKDGGSHIRSDKHTELKCDAGNKGKIHIRGNHIMSDRAEKADTIKVENASAEAHIGTDDLKINNSEENPEITIKRTAQGKHAGSTKITLGDEK